MAEIEIPIEAINEARNALADEYLTLTLALDRAGLMTRLHRKRIEQKIIKIDLYLAQLDLWLKGVKI